MNVLLLHNFIHFFVMHDSQSFVCVFLCTVCISVTCMNVFLCVCANVIIFICVIVLAAYGGVSWLKCMMPQTHVCVWGLSLSLSFLNLVMWSFYHLCHTEMLFVSERCCSDSMATQKEMLLSILYRIQCDETILMIFSAVNISTLSAIFLGILVSAKLETGQNR